MRFFWRTSAPGTEQAAKKPLRCSFCNKTQDDVAKLIAGPALFICDECVAICVEIIEDDTRISWPATREPAANTGPAESRLPGDPTAPACALCRAPVQASDAFTIPGRGMLCAECEALVVLAVDNRFPHDK